MATTADAAFLVEPTEVGLTLAAIVRGRGFAKTWNEARRLVETGKVWIEGRVESLRNLSDQPAVAFVVYGAPGSDPSA